MNDKKIVTQNNKTKRKYNKIILRSTSIINKDSKKDFGDGLGWDEASEGSALVATGKTDAQYFLRLLHRGWKQKEAKIKAGYSPKTSTKAILASKACMQVARSVDEARQLVQAKPGHTFTDNAEVLTEIRDNPDTPENVKVSAIKEHNEMNGYKAPQQIQMESKSLIVELGGLTPDDLKALGNGEIII